LGILYNSIERKILIAILMIMVAVTFANVVMRYVFNDSFFWSEEFARYLFIWFSWLGVSAGLSDKAHLRVELLGKGLIKKGLFKVNESVALLVSLIWLTTTLIVAYYGIQIIEMQIRLAAVTPAMRIPVWIGYLAIPFSSILVGIRLIISLVNNVKVLLGVKKPEALDRAENFETSESGVKL
jgi:TRAP-type C4-dicarboxylate transport system permease small subunit